MPRGTHGTGQTRDCGTVPNLPDAPIVRAAGAMSIMPYVWFLTICVVWGSSFILMKRAAVCLSPIAIGAGRVLLGAAVMAVVWRSLGEPVRVRRKDAGPLLAVAILGFAWPYCLQPELISRHGSAFIGMTVGFTPLLTLALLAGVLRTPVTARQLCGVLGALACLCVLMWDGWQRSISVGDLCLAFSVPATYFYRQCSHSP